MPETENLFEYMDLNEIDPNFAPIESGFYNLRIVEFKRKPYFFKPEDPKVIAGEAEQGELKGERFAYRVVIQDHPELSGRSVRGNLWPRPSTAKALRRVMDATGIPQVGTFDEWCEDISTERPVVRSFVRSEPSKEDPAVNNVEVNWFEVQPAEAVAV